MKHLWSGCHIAFKYLVLYFKFNHFSLNDPTLFSLSQETSHSFVKWTGITVSVQSHLILTPFLLPALNSFGHCSPKMNLLKIKLIHKNLFFVLWNTNITPANSNGWLLTLIISMKNQIDFCDQLRWFGEKNSIILFGSVICLFVIWASLRCSMPNLSTQTTFCTSFLKP